MQHDGQRQQQQDSQPQRQQQSKPPRPGLAKTRLAARLGPGGAANLAAAFVRDAWARLHRWGRARVVLAGTSARVADYGLPGPVELWPQGAGDLGARMARIARRGLAEADLVLLVGADAPAVGPARLEAAHRAARTHDAVLGPTRDGGYDLLALRRCPPGLLRDLPWSSPRTAAATCDRLRARGLSLATLDRTYDVDEPDDLAGLVRDVAAGRVEAPATARALARLGLLPGPGAPAPEPATDRPRSCRPAS